jgi:CRP/FNR family transcriptional regulator, cyclic AMP receptor protein
MCRAARSKWFTHSLRGLHEDKDIADRFIAYMLKRNSKTELDLVDQLFNSTEKRLARRIIAFGAIRQGR